MTKAARARIHLPVKPQPEIEQRLAEHFRKLLAAHADDIAGQAARLYAETIKVAKYSPDQPRDEHGRWTSGGEGESKSTGPQPFHTRDEAYS